MTENVMKNTIERLATALYRVNQWSDEYKYYCPYCLALFKEKVEKCPFCGSRNIKKNEFSDFIRDAIILE